MRKLNELTAPYVGRLVIGYADLRKALARQDGQGLVEYALIASLIGLACFAALTASGTSLKGLFSKTAADV